MAYKSKAVHPGQLEFARIAVRVSPPRMRKGIIDRNLRLMCAARTPGRCYSQEEIGEFIGVSQQLVNLIEKSALSKVAAEWEKKRVLSEMYEHWKQS